MADLLSSGLLDDIARALSLHLKRHPDLPWSIGTVNQAHTSSPFGAGVCVTLHGPTGEVVWEKDRSFESAMKRASDRLDRRIAGERGA